MKIRALTGVVVLLKIPVRVPVSEIKRVLLHYAETFYITQYNLVTDDGVVLKDILPLAHQIEESWRKPGKSIYLTMVPAPYTYRAVREHVMRVREIHSNDHAELPITYAFTAPSTEAPTTERKSGMAANVFPLLSCPSIVNMHVSGTNPFCLDSEDERPFLYSTSKVLAKEVVKLCKNPFTASQASQVGLAALKQPAVGVSTSDPLTHRKLRGDISYFTVSFGKQTWGVGACAGGFYLLEKDDLSSHTRTSDIYPTLICLLCAVVPDQRQRYESLVHMIADSRPGACVFEGMLPSVPSRVGGGYGLGSLGPHGTAQWLTDPPQPFVRDLWRTNEHEFFVNQPQDLRAPQRNWVSPFLSSADSDSSRQQNIPTVLYEQVYPEFLSTAMQATVLAVDGTLSPLDSSVPFEERTYIFNGISISFCVDDDKRRRAAPSWSRVHKESALSALLSPDVLCLGRTEVCFGTSCCVDYHGYRAWCEAFSYDYYDKFGLSKTAFRESPTDDPLPHAEGVAKLAEGVQQSDSSFAPLFPKIFNLDTHDGQWAVPEGLHVYKSRDGRFYIDGINHVVPTGRRIELLVLSHEESEEAVSSSSTPKHNAPCTGDSASSGGSSFGTNELQSRPSISSTPVHNNPRRYDDNEGKDLDAICCVSASSGGSASHASQAALDALLEQQIHRFYDALAAGTVCPADGADLAKQMHDKGIPMRCLGRLIDAESKPALPACVTRLLHLECVARSAKHFIRALLREHRAQGVAQPLSEYLNVLYSNPHSPQACEVADRIAKHFGVTSTKTWRGSHEDEWYVLRSICVKVGIRLAGREFAFSKDNIFRKGDFVDLVVVPYGAMEGVSLTQAQERLEEGDVRGGLRDLKLKLSDIADSNGWDSALLNPLLFSMGKVALQEGEPIAAASLFSRAAASARLAYGEDSTDFQCAVLNAAVSVFTSHQPQYISHTNILDITASLSSIATSTTQHAAAAQSLIQEFKDLSVL